jgi:hypothetical protein
MAQMKTLQDDFHHSSLDSSKWALINASSTRVSITNKRLEVTSHTVVDTYDGIHSVNYYDLTASCAFVRVLNAGSQSITTLQSFIGVNVDTSNGLIFWIGNGTIYAQKQVAGTYTSFYSKAYNSNIHKWLKIREAGGTVYWDYSTDGKTWTNFTTLANPFAVTSMYAVVSAGIYGTEASTTTVIFDNFNVPGTTGATNKEHVYKWYTDSGFNSILQDVTSKLNLTEQINTAGSQIEIELGINFQDSDPTLTTDLLVDEDENLIVTDQLESIIVGEDITITGFPALNDRIEVWEYSTDYPDGLLMFNGLVSKWSSDYKSNTTKISVISYGVQLDNYLVQTMPDTVVTSNPETNYDGYYTLYDTDGKFETTNTINKMAQVFQVGSDLDLGSVSISLGKLQPFQVAYTIAIYEGTPLNQGSLLGSVSQYLADTNQIMRDFVFSTTISLTASTDYYIEITNDATRDVDIMNIGTQSTGTYTGGSAYYYEQNIGWNSTPLTEDMIFEVYTSGGGVGQEFLSTDPGAIARQLMDNFISLGGVLTYTTDTIALTGTTVSYTFRFTKYLEAIKKCVELAPADWWWRVDSATGLLYFQSLSQEVDHTFILGKHLENLTIESSLEDVTNVVYYSGGDDGSGTNLLVTTSDATSISEYGTWLTTVSDNRVNLEETADILSESLLNQYKDPRYMTTISIPASVYDLNLISVGEIIGFGNFNTFVDSLRLQVMSKTYTPDMVTLKLAILPPTVSKRIEDIKRNLDKQQTENNPDT